MPKYGVHGFLLEGSWDNQIASKVIAEVAELGFDLIEIPVQNPNEFDSALIGKLLSENNLEGVASLALPKDLHAPVHPKEALEFLKKSVDRVRDFGGKSLNGCLYCNLGTLTGAPATREEKKTIVEVLGKLHSYAKEAGVRLGVEPVNRYETYLYNTGADAAELIRSIGVDDMIVHFDTYHMNIERRAIARRSKRWARSLRTFISPKAIEVCLVKAR